MINANRIPQPILNDSLLLNIEKNDSGSSTKPKKTSAAPATSSAPNNAFQQQAKLKETMIANPLPARLQETLVLQGQMASTSSEVAIQTEKLLNEQQELELLNNEILKLAENTGLAGGRTTGRSNSNPNRPQIDFMMGSSDLVRFDLNATQRASYSVASDLYSQLISEISNLMNSGASRSSVTTRVIESNLSGTISNLNRAIENFNGMSPNVRLPNYSIAELRSLFTG